MKKIELALVALFILTANLFISCSEETLGKDNDTNKTPEVSDTIKLASIVQAHYQGISETQTSYTLAAASAQADWDASEQKFTLSEGQWGVCLHLVAATEKNQDLALLPEGSYNKQQEGEDNYFDNEKSFITFQKGSEEAVSCPINKAIQVVRDNNVTACYIESTMNDKPLMLVISGDFKFKTEKVLEFKYTPIAFCDKSSGENANYYLALTTVPSKYDKEQNNLSLEGPGYTLVLDLYGDVTEEQITIPDGEYNLNNNNGSFTYSEYSLFAFQDGQNDFETQVNGTIKVSHSENNTVLEALVKTEKGDYRCKFNGEILFEEAVQNGGGNLPQIDHDILPEFTGALGSYRGNLFQAGTGNMVINLYDCEFDPTTGGHTGIGYCVSLCLFNTLFSNPADAVVKPAEYTLARNFKKYTWYPGVEVDYMGVTMILGSFCQQHNADGTYAYSCISDGVINITEGESGVFTVTVDATTNSGYAVKGTYTGEIPVIDQSEDKAKAVISTLKDDYELNLSQLDTARVYKQEDINNCSRFILDLGSPSGKDSTIVENGGDIFRIDLLTEPGKETFPEGTYNIMEDKYDEFYKPFKLLKGHFANGGDLCGTRWFHFKEGRYMVADGLAPAMEGSVSILKLEDGTYNVKIDVLDDADYRITGEWTGIVQYVVEKPEADKKPAEELTPATPAKKGTVASKYYRPLHSKINKIRK